MLDWFVEYIQIENYRKLLVEYCNNKYCDIGWKTIKDKDLEDEINITAIAIDIKENASKKYKMLYPEISFYGDCKCDPEHGICIGFRDYKLLGIGSQDWTL